MFFLTLFLRFSYLVLFELCSLGVNLTDLLLCKCLYVGISEVTEGLIENFLSCLICVVVSAIPVSFLQENHLLITCNS